MGKRKGKSNILITFVRDYHKTYQFYKCGSLFLLKKGLYMVLRRRRVCQEIRKDVRGSYGNVRIIFQKEWKLKLWLKPVFLRGRIANGDIKLMSQDTKYDVLKYIWSECDWG